MTGKERYEHIEIPAQLTGVIDAQKKAVARKRSMRLTRYSSVVAPPLPCYSWSTSRRWPTPYPKSLWWAIVQVLQFGAEASGPTALPWARKLPKTY